MQISSKHRAVKLFKKQIILLFLFAVTGCTSEISFDQGEYQSKIVVDGWIEPDRLANVYLTFSSPFLTQYDSASVAKSFLNHAKVTITTGSGEEEILTLFKKETFFPPYVYKTTSLKGVIGQTYHLKIEYSGNILTATTTIPDCPKIQSISYNERSPDNGSLIIKYIPGEKSPYYYFQTAQQSSDYKFVPTYYPIQTIVPETNAIAEFELFKGSKNNILNSEEDVVKQDTILPRYYWSKDTVLVIISSIDNQSYDVLNSITDQLSNTQNPLSVSSPALTNINGGLGRWTGLGSSKVIFYVESQDSVYNQ